MKSTFIADGESRLKACPEFQMRLRQLHAAIRERHAKALAEAGFLDRLAVRWRMRQDYRRESLAMQPSAASLHLERH